MLGFIAGAALSVGAPQTLWTTLNRGDDVNVVAEKVQQLPEVKAVKVKAAKSGKEPKISIEYHGEGVQILGGGYDLDLMFEAGRLRSVFLVARDTCRNTVYQRYSGLLDVLQAKYPSIADEALPIRDKGDFIRAEIATNTAASGLVETALTNESVAVVITVSMFGIQPPTIGYASTAATRAIRDLQWQIYRNQASACGGDGANRAVLRLQYLAREAFDASLAKERREKSGERQSAEERL